MSSTNAGILLSKNASTANVQAIPATIHHNGEANIETHFKSISTTEQQQNTLRGRPLQGKVVNLPPQVQGYVIKEGKTKEWETLRTFDKISVWKLDDSPDNEKELHGALEWIDIAQLVYF